MAVNKVVDNFDEAIIIAPDLKEIELI